MSGGALVLAAGLSRRFGSDKRQFLLDDKTPLLRRAVEIVLAANLSCRVCVRADDSAALALLQDLPVSIIECHSAEQGMGRTLAEGVAACQDWDGLLVMLADMPWLRPQTLALLFAALTPDAIVQPTCAEQPGNPVGFGRAFYPDLLALQGDQGGRALLQRYPHALRHLEVGDPAIHRDIDVESDLLAAAGD